MAFHSQGPNPRESWGEFTCRYGPAWSDCEWGREESPSCNSGWDILCCPCDPLPVQHRWGCLVVIDYILLFWFFFLWKSCRFPFFRSVGASYPVSDCISLDTKRKTHGVLRWVAFPRRQQLDMGTLLFSWGYKGRETIIDQGEKPKQAKFPKPGFHEPPQEWGLFSVWFPTQQ